MPSTTFGLQTLTPERTTYLFLVTFIIGIATIIPPWPNPWLSMFIPVIPLTGYSLVLWTAQTRYMVSHTSTVKTSPYILGFSFTLVALLNLFVRASANLDSQTFDANALVGQIGAAISTTIVGLLCRQLLILYDPSERLQQGVFESLAEQMREHATEFDRAQRKLITVVQEFTDERETLFKKEIQASSSYLAHLTKTSEALAEIETLIPERLHTVADSLHSTTNIINEASSSSEAALSALTSSVQKDQEQASAATAELVKVLQEGATSTTTATTGIVQKLSEATSAIQRTAEATRATVKELGACSSRLDGIVKRLAEAPDEFSRSLSSATQRSSELDKEVATRLSSVVEDIRAIDTIVDDVTTLLSKRIERADR